MQGSYSKKQVKRAGEVLSGARKASRHDLGEAATIAEWWRAEHERPMRLVNAGLRHYVGADARVTQRLKRRATILDKLVRLPQMDLSRMEDIGGVRVLLQEQDDILNVVKRLQRRWHIRRARFYIEGGEPGPKEDGYRAVHLIVAKNERFVEVQFRTPAQDDWANSVEQDTRLEPGLGLKWGSGPSDLREYYRVIAEYMAASDRGIEADPELRDQMVRLYAATRKHFPPAAES